jgi:NAD(P)-dependent dehydrogenase (short-subunit alcohol dehydrogenase family)
MHRFVDTVVLVTGATSGFGLAIARAFHAEKARVVFTSADRGRLAAAAAQLPGADGVLADARDPADWEALARHVGDAFGRIDILVNNAGGAVAVADTVDQSVENLDEIIRLNLQSVAYGCRVFGRMMRDKRGGTIVNISSACASHAWPGFSLYAAAKAGVESLSRGLYLELRPFGVRVATVEPGAARTGFSRRAGLPEPSAPYLLEAGHVADAVLHICSQPACVWVEKYVLWGTDQEVIPL